MLVRVYTNGDANWWDAVVNALSADIAPLGVSLRDLAIHVDDDPNDWPDGALILYRHRSGASVSAGDSSALSDHIDEGRQVVPIVDDLAAAEKLPLVLQKQNAFRCDRYGGGAAVALADEILSALWLARSRRKIFISYRRAASAEMAQQLRAALSLLGWDVFLDEASIESGRDFEREVRASIADADLLLVLATPDIDASYWVREEVDCAAAWQITVLALCWALPGYVPPLLVQSLFADQRMAIVPSADTLAAAGGILTDAALETVLTRLYQERARATRARLETLLPHAREWYAANGLHSVSHGIGLGDLLVDGRYVRVVPFRPTLQTLYDLERFVERACAQGTLKRTPDSLACYYAEIEPDASPAQALEWLGQRPAFRIVIDRLLGGA